MTTIMDLMKFRAILENVHTWAMREQRPRISCCIDMWRARFPFPDEFKAEEGPTCESSPPIHSECYNGCGCGGEETQWVDSNEQDVEPEGEVEESKAEDTAADIYYPEETQLVDSNEKDAEPEGEAEESEAEESEAEEGEAEDTATDVYDPEETQLVDSNEKDAEPEGEAEESEAEDTATDVYHLEETEWFDLNERHAERDVEESGANEGSEPQESKLVESEEESEEDYEAEDTAPDAYYHHPDTQQPGTFEPDSPHERPITLFSTEARIAEFTFEQPAPTWEKSAATSDCDYPTQAADTTLQTNPSDETFDIPVLQFERINLESTPPGSNVSTPFDSTSFYGTAYDFTPPRSEVNSHLNSRQKWHGRSRSLSSRGVGVMQRARATPQTPEPTPSEISRFRCDLDDAEGLGVGQVGLPIGSVQASQESYFDALTTTSK